MPDSDSAKPVHVAVVDDDSGVLDAVQLVLETEGWAVSTFPNGEDFLASLNSDAPDCLILDPHLPGLNGAEVIQAVSRGGRSIPTICLSARPDTPIAREVLANGAQAVLTKPVKAENLVGVVRDLLA